MSGIKMRATVPSGPRKLASPSECGYPEVTGPVVFREYFNDEKATADALTNDGWFKTGECLLNLAYFLDLIPEQRAAELSPIRHDVPRSQALEHVVRVAAPARMAELSLIPHALALWAGVAFSLQSMACDCEPRGAAAAMDVFYCMSLVAVASSKEEWLADHLSKWTGFCRTEVRFHEVGGGALYDDLVGLCGRVAEDAERVLKARCLSFVASYWWGMPPYG